VSIREKIWNHFLTLAEGEWKILEYMYLMMNKEILPID